MSKVSKNPTNLAGVPATLLIPLRARALESLDPKGIIKDNRSVEIANLLSCDIRPGSESFFTQVGTSQRTIVFDDYTKDFLARNPEGTIINLACGLDTRFERLDNGLVRWFELDLPEVIEIRRRFFKETERYKFIEKSAFDFTWLDDIPKDQPVFISAEGLFCYFKEDQIKDLFTVTAKRFENVEFAFEAMSPWVVNNTDKHPSMKKQTARFKWGIDSGKEIDAWNTGFRFVSERFYMEECRKRSLSLRIMNLLPFFRKCSKIILMKKQ
ncbi:MAG: class I SAM-dependent methyltransferase [Candidatus Riflebacteria bacterium]|nr:class I SAM-dependent methyltransferase [Candidatus Riflebacteria bacterium]